MNTKPDEAADVAARLLRRRPAALITDIDGTLSPIVSSPEDAVVLPQGREALRKLLRLLDVVAVVSGRTVQNARRMVGLDDLLYIGNHGQERWDRRTGYRNEAAAFAGELRELREKLERELATIEGARIEDKATILSVHYRNAPEPAAARERIVKTLNRVVAFDRYVLSEGKMVVEVRPNLPLDKGSVVKSLVAEHRLKSVVFLGDDRTDIDAMAALRELRPGLLSLAIGVGSDEAPAELAETSDTMLAGPSEVGAFLTRLASSLQTHINLPKDRG
ncbi:MAG: trehalose-phosphatase [Dehalococcoidia bacterium]